MKKKNIHSIIAKRIREERIKLNLTQEELAEKAGIDHKYLSVIERNAGKTSLDTFVKIADALNMPYYELLSDNINSNKSESLEQIKYLLSGLSPNKIIYIANIIKEIKKIMKI